MKKFIAFDGDVSACTVEWVNDEDVDGYPTMEQAHAEADRLNHLIESADEELTAGGGEAMSKFMVRREQLEDETVYYQVISAEMHEFLSAAHIEADRLNALLEGAEAQAAALAECQARKAEWKKWDERHDKYALAKGFDRQSLELLALHAELARLREAMLEACEHIEQHRYGIGMLALNEALAQEVEKP